MPSTTSRKVEQSRRLRQRAENMIQGGVNSPVRAFGSVGGEPPFIVGERFAYLGRRRKRIHRLRRFVGTADFRTRRARCVGCDCGRRLQRDQLWSFNAGRGRSGGVGAGGVSPDAESSVREFRDRSHDVRDSTGAGLYQAKIYRQVRRLLPRSLRFPAGEGGFRGGYAGIPGSAGVPEEFIQFTLALPFNDIKAVEYAFQKYKHQIACVIVEPVVGNMGCVPAADDFLVGLRMITEREKAVLIFDEVMTGFRVAFGGAQELYSIRPDLTTLGKIIGGGLPVGAYGGSSEMMDLVAPLGPMYQAGTLSGNPLAMAAGCAMLKRLRDQKQEIYPRLEKMSGELVEGVAAAAKDAGVPLCFNRVGSMFTWFFTEGPVTDWESASKSSTEAFGKFFRSMLDSGVYLPPSQFEAAFLGATHTEEDVQRTVAAAREAFASVGTGL